MKKTPYVYCICRIDKKYWQQINHDLEIRGYKGVKSYIPVVKVFQKIKAGKHIYSSIPLLFNYGFIKMKSERAFNRQFLLKLKREIPGILSWVNASDSLFPKKKRIRIDNAEDFDDFSIVATISREQLRYYNKISKRKSIYSLEEITKINIGDYITLRGYPFEGIGALVNEINLNTKMLTVTIYPGKGSMVIQIPIDNVVYSIYSDFDEDNLQCPSKEIDISKVEDGSTEEYLDSKQY